MEVLTHVIPSLVQQACLPLLGICLAAWTSLLLMHAVALRFRRVGAGRGGRLSWIAFAAMAVACTVFSGKNSPQNNGGPRFAPPRGGTLTDVTEDDISNGWRIVSEQLAGAFAAMPSNAVVNDRWCLRGAHDDAFRIPAEGWSYPGLDGVTVLSRGEIRADVATPHFPRPFEQDLSLVPQANWHLLGWATNSQFAGNGSQFWHAATPSNTLLATWCNAAPDREPANAVSFQAELFPGGDFAYRYEDRTVRYAYVWPFDWDGDGLENSVDPDPFTAGADAHGTNAEWYNAVCSNVFSAVEGTNGVVLAWNDGVNSNAYYFVDVVTTNGPAPIYFTGDGECRLGNPVVVANAFETNRVPLLIGIDYAITSPVPISVSAQGSEFVAISTNSVCQYGVRWPLEFVFTESITSSNRVYAVSVEPYDPGGSFTWDEPGGARLLGASTNSTCNCLLYGNNTVSYSCLSECTCPGNCGASGTYNLEGAGFGVSGGQCRCGFEDPSADPGPGTHSPDDGPSLTIAFSKSAVIFEDAYEDRPGVFVPRRSTRVRLTVDAYGGTHGGTLSLSSANLDKLTPVGMGIQLPLNQIQLSERCSIHMSAVYEGTAASDTNGDVRVYGTLDPNSGGETIQVNSNLTVVRILLQPEICAPENSASGRHTYGIYELVRKKQLPTLPTLTWNTVGGGTNTLGNGAQPCYRFPGFAKINPLRVELFDVAYAPLLKCIEPSGITVREVELCTYGLPSGKAGGVGLLQAFYVEPFTVSFSQVAIQEVPCDRGTVEGYFRYAFTTNLWTHTRDAGAGRWQNVDVNNRMGDSYYRDEAAIDIELLPITSDGMLTNDYTLGWVDGYMSWDIPFGWNTLNTASNTPPVGVFGNAKQEFHIDCFGHTAVRKFRNQVTRRIDDTRYLNGISVSNNVVRVPKE